jgi:two-component system OmpR family sensor kinase
MSSLASRRWLVGGTAIYVGMLIVVVVGLVLLYRAARDRLDDSLGQRLTAIAVTTTQLVDPDQITIWSLDPVEPIDYLWLVTRFEQIRRSNDLAELSLCDSAGFVVISAADRTPRGELNAFWDLDRTAVDLALAGFPAASKLYQSGSLYQKSAHAPVFDAEGEVVAVVTAEAAVDFFDTLATLRDGAVTTGGIVVAFLMLSAVAIIRLHRAQERARADLVRQENLAAMGRMTAGIAHEIRNPLGVIRGAGQHLQRRLEQAGIEDPMADFIPEEVDRLDRILSSYLSFGRGTESKPEPLDLAEVVARTARLLEEEFSHTGIRIETRAVDLPVRGDRPRLQQILLNLLLNARDAMPDGGTILIEGTVVARTVVITVTDEGVGLGGHDPESLFAAFQTGKEKGSGLGLAVSRQIAEAHGGTLRLASRADRSGAVATLTLPADENGS